MKRKEIINAETPILIEVPAQLTKSTRQKNPYHCVFAEACNRIPQVEEAIIHVSTAYLRFRDEKVLVDGERVFRRYRVKTTLRDQIVMFDQARIFIPGQYTLSVIQPSHRASGRRQGSDKNGTSFRAPGSYRRKVPLTGVRAPARISAL